MEYLKADVGKRVIGLETEKSRVTRLPSVFLSLKGGGSILSDGVMKKSIKISFDDYSISVPCEKYVGRM